MALSRKYDHSDGLMYEMGSVMKILGLSLWLYFATHGSVVSKSSPVISNNGTVHVDGRVSIGITDEDFICATMDWWPPSKCDYGTCSWGNASLLNLDLSNKILRNAIKEFSPLKIRLGGTLQDKLRYQSSNDPRPCIEFVRNSSHMFGFTEGCLPMTRWDELNNFFRTTGAEIIFGLNALIGRTIGSDGTCTGAWNSSNAESLIRHTVNSGYAIHAWELGNELSGSGVGARVSADQYAIDTINLQNVVQKIYSGFQTKPLVLGPGGFFDADWFTRYVHGASNSLQAVTHHIYNLGPGVDDHLIEKILDPSYLDNGAQLFKNLQSILKNSGTSVIAWVGESGGAYNSGRNLVTNAFVFSFWYLDQLGLSSSFDSKTYCRQSLIGGNYGLLDTTTFLPNPDYYSALLWHRLMGRKVLSTSFDGTKKIRAYAHCSKNSTGITLLLINLDNTTTVQVNLSIDNNSPKFASVSDQTKSMKFPRSYQHETENETREEYHLTAKDGDLHSKIMLLNGEAIAVNSSGIIPPLEPRIVDMYELISVAPFSIVFSHLPSISVPACL